MRDFYPTYPKLDAVRRELSWTHYRILLRVEKPLARAFYEVEAVNSRWSTRELERQIHALLFERLALSRDKEDVLALAQKGHEIHRPTDLVKDPYIVDVRHDNREGIADAVSRTLGRRCCSVEKLDGRRKSCQLFPGAAGKAGSFSYDLCRISTEQGGV